VFGLVIMAGTTFIDYVTFRVFWNLISEGNQGAFGLLPLMAKYGTFVKIGAAVLISTGIGMLALKASVLDQLWFKVKLVLVALLIVNGMFVGNANGIAFRKMIANPGPNFIEQTSSVRTTLGRFYISQLVLFGIIILASTTKVGEPVTLE